MWSTYYSSCPLLFFTPYCLWLVASPTTTGTSAGTRGKCHEKSGIYYIHGYFATDPSQVVGKTTISWRECWTPPPTWGRAWSPHTSSSRRLIGRGTAKVLPQICMPPVIRNLMLPMQGVHGFQPDNNAGRMLKLKRALVASLLYLLYHTSFSRASWIARTNRK